MGKKKEGQSELCHTVLCGKKIKGQGEFAMPSSSERGGGGKAGHAMLGKDEKGARRVCHTVPSGKMRKGQSVFAITYPREREERVKASCAMPCYALCHVLCRVRLNEGERTGVEKLSL